MKKRLLAIILLLGFTLSAAVLVPAANSAGPVMVFNDAKVTIEGKPALREGGNLYVPIEFFTSFSNVRSVYDGLSDTLSVFNALYTLSFNIKEGTCTNQQMETYVARTFFKNGTFYVSPSFVASQMYFGYRYLADGDIVRVTNSYAQLSDEELLDKLTPPTVPAPPSDPEIAEDRQRPDEPKAPVAEIRKKMLFLVFDAGAAADSEAIVQILRDRNIRATLFFSADNLAKKHQVLRDLLVGECVIGLSCSPAANSVETANLPPLTAEGSSRTAGGEILSALESANDTLQKIGKVRTRLYRPANGEWSLLDSAARSALTDAGYVLAGAHYDLRPQLQFDTNTAVRKISARIQSSDGSSAILLLPASSATVRILPSLLATLRSEGHRFYPLDETNAVAP